MCAFIQLDLKLQCIPSILVSWQRDIPAVELHHSLPAPQNTSGTRYCAQTSTKVRANMVFNLLMGCHHKSILLKKLPLQSLPLMKYLVN